MPTTSELVKSAQAGDRSAFAKLVRRYERAAIVTAYSVLGDFHRAQDAAQEAFIVCYKKMGGVRDPGSFGPWLLRIARRTAARQRRRRINEFVCADCIEPASRPNPDWLEPYKDIIDRLARLPEHERIVTVMRYVDGRSVGEIAELTGRPVGTITKQLSRAIERLRHWFSEVRS
jgi:RNA polymerase sigma-70 factor, ECF subfamily